MQTGAFSEFRHTTKTFQGGRRRKLQIELGVRGTAQGQPSTARRNLRPAARLDLDIQTRDARSGDLFNYIVDLGNGEISLAFGEPAWAAEYWARKSSLFAPGMPALKLEVTENNRRTRPVPFNDGFANGGAQTPDPHNPVDAFEHEVTLRFAGKEIGHWVNGAPMAGTSMSRRSQSENA